MKKLKNLTPAQVMAFALFVDNLTNEFGGIEGFMVLKHQAKVRHEIEEFKEFFEAFKKFGLAVLEVAEHKTENHFKAEEGKEANNG